MTEARFRYRLSFVSYLMSYDVICHDVIHLIHIGGEIRELWELELTHFGADLALDTAGRERSLPPLRRQQNYGVRDPTARDNYPPMLSCQVYSDTTMREDR